MTVGEKIKERRKELGLSQQELAERLGNKNKASVCRVEKNVEDLTTTRIMAYAKALGVPVDTLMIDIIPENFTLSAQEKDMITKFRKIDASSRRHVLALLDVAYDEYEKRKENEKPR